MSRTTSDRRPGRPAEAAGRPPVFEEATQVFGRGAFARRAKAVRRSRWRWRVTLLLVTVLLAVLAWLVWWSPVLVVKTVAVQGVRGSTLDQVRAAAAVPEGRQLARLDLAAITRRVEGVPAVASARVERRWPGTVAIRVTPRVPVAVVTDAQGGLHLADRTGTSYAEVAAAPANLPKVTADASNPAAVHAVLTVLGDLPAGLRGEVASAGARTPDDVRLSVGKVTVVWGSATDDALKVEVLKALRKANPDARRFDLSAPQTPAVG